MRFITGDESVDDLWEALHGKGLSSECGLTRVGLVRFIDRFLVNELSSDQLAEIADILEMNERILLPEADHSPVTEALFQLASPEINGPITTIRAEEIRKDLLADV